MFFVLTVVLIIALVGSIPKWPHSKGWGYFPSVGLGLVLLVGHNAPPLVRFPLYGVLNHPL
jgi:hypothetical protein